MTGLANRRTRVLRVRQLQHRAAKAELHTADSAVDELNGIAARISALRATLNPAGGYTRGLDLHALFEMGLRLDNARSDLAQPMKAAAMERDRLNHARQAAHRLEDGASRLHDKAQRSAEATQLLRHDANRAPRRTSRRTKPC